MLLTNDDMREIEESAKTGLMPDEHEEYERRVNQLKTERMEIFIHKLAAEFDYIIDTVRNGDTVDTVARARQFLGG